MTNEERILALLERHDGMLQKQGEILQWHSEMLQKQGETLQQHSEILQQHSEMLQKQGEILQQHSEMLQKQGETLQQHSEMLQKQGEILQQHSEMLQKQGETLQRHDEALERLQADVTQIKVRQENEVEKKLQLLAEGHQTLLDTLASKTRVEALEDDVLFLKTVVRSLTQEVAELRKAQ